MAKQPKQPKQPRRRGPARRECDRARAAKHQASHNPKDSVSDEVMADVILPFIGKMLPITAILEPYPNHLPNPHPNLQPKLPLLMQLQPQDQHLLHQLLVQHQLN